MTQVLKANSMEDAMNDNFVQEEVIESAETSIETAETTIDENASELVDATVETTVEAVTEITAAPEKEVVEVIKEVEKIVEKYPDMDEYSLSILTAIQNKDEDKILEYLSEKKKDYAVMSDLDVAREHLKKNNPSWTDRDIDVELRVKYGKGFEKVDIDAIDQDLDPDKYEAAVRHNEEVERRELILARDARDARISLNEAKKNIEFPKISSEQKQVETPQPTAEEEAEAKRQWDSLVESEVPKFSDFKFTVDGEEVSYKVTDEEKKAMTDSMKDFNALNYLTDRGWFDENGNPNVLRITEDVYKLDNSDKLIKSVAAQIKTATKKEVISKDIKNLDLDRKSTSDIKVNKSFADAVLDA